VVLALHNYHDTHGHFPPAVVYGEDDQPLYSWRVLILPFLEQEPLYKQFYLDEPWDSARNIQLVSRMPSIYALPPRKAAKMGVPAGHTVCHVFVGKNAAFEGKEGLRMTDFTDGLSNTILVIEAGEPVPWTKPEDLAYDPDEPLPDLRSPFKDIIRVGMGDGSRRHLPISMTEQTLRAAITRNAHDLLGPDW
jgi:hypothetical protein